MLKFRMGEAWQNIMSRLQCLDKGRPVPDACSVSLMTLEFLADKS